MEKEQLTGRKRIFQRVAVYMKENAAQLTVLLLVTVVLSFFTAQKEGYHMDELLSFELANAEFNPWIVPTQPEGRLARLYHNEIQGETLGETLANLADMAADALKNRGNSLIAGYKADVSDEPVWIERQQFKDYIEVDDKDAFNLASVYFNVKDDNHPPLHFMVLHVISSVVRGRVEPFMGCVINIAAVLGCCILIMRLGRLNGQREAGIAAALLYGLSSGAVATTLLIRMYGMLTFFCVAFFYLNYLKWKRKEFTSHNGLLILVTVLGFWTQYFFLFYCMVLALVLTVLLMREKRWKDMWCYIRSMLTAAIIGLAGFPFAVSDVFFSGRGVEALENLSGGLNGYGARLAEFGRILLVRTFGSMRNALVLTALMAAAGTAAWLKERSRSGRNVADRQGECGGNVAGGQGECGGNVAGRQGECGGNIEAAEHGAVGKNRERRENAILLIVPAVGYFLLAARMSPYLVDRYIMAVFPFAGMLCAWGITAVCRKIFSCAGKTEAGETADAGAGTEKAVPEKAGTDKAVPERPALEKAALLVITAVFCIMNVLSYDGEYLYRGYRMQEQAAEENLPCICIYDGVGYYENLKEFTHYEKTLLLKPEELEQRQDVESVSSLEQAAVLIKGPLDVEAVTEVLEEKYGLYPAEMVIEDSVYGDWIQIFRKSNR